MSVAFDCGVKVGCGGRVSVLGSDVTGTSVSDGDREQAVRSAVIRSKAKNTDKYLPILKGA